MRVLLLSMAMLTGCFGETQRTCGFYGNECPKNAAEAVVYEAAAGAETLAAEGESHVDHDPVTQEQPSAVVAAPHPGAFDRESARKALASTMVKDCGKGGEGDVLVTFSPDGSVAEVQIERGEYGQNTAACIIGRFEQARMKPFSGKAHTVRWHVEL